MVILTVEAPLAKDDPPVWALVALGFLGVAGAALAMDYMRKNQTYSCYRCNTAVTWGTQNCPTCGAPFRWDAAKA